MKTPTLTLKQRIALPPKAVTRVNLQTAASQLRHMQPATVIIRDYGDRDQLAARCKELEAELQAANNHAKERAHREDRIKAITIRVVDNRQAWAAKMGLKNQAPFVAITSRQIITADVWQQCLNDDA